MTNQVNLNEELRERIEQTLAPMEDDVVKMLGTWDPCHARETEQLDSFEQLQMFGKTELIDPKLNPIILQPHWQHNVKRDGTQRARLCCNGSKCAAPVLHALALTHSLCAEHPVQRLFCAVAAQLNKNACGGDAKDAHAHSPGSEIETHVKVDNACAEGCEMKHGETLDRRKVLPNT